MKNLKFLLAAMAVGAVTSCSDNTAVDNGADKAHWNADGTGYISLAINLPSQQSAGTRTDNTDNDQFDDGDANEYAVSDAVLLLFNTTGNDKTEEAATFAGAYDLNLNWNVNNSSTDNVTSTAKITQKINETPGDIYALVLLNAKATGLYKEKNSTIKLNDCELTKGSTKLKDLQESAQLSASNVYKDYNGKKSSFFMCNAPLTTKPSVASDFSAGDVQTLAKVTGQVYSSEADANAAEPAADIYVERAVAKVTLAKSATSAVFEVNPTGKSKDIVEYDITGWTLDNTNNTGYIVRNTQSSEWDKWKSLRSNNSTVQSKKTGYRFQGADPVNNTASSKLYRTYWALDPNYNTTTPTTKGSLNVVSSTTDWGKTVDANKNTIPQYCLDNTFDVANQSVENTTRALLEITYGGSSNTEDWYTYGDYTNTLQKKSDFEKTIKKFATAMPEWDSNYSKDDKIEITFSDRTNDGYVTITLKYDNSECSKEVNTAINNLLPKIACYKGGKAYYSVLIKHFGDQLTPWNTWETGTKPTAGSISTIYPTNNENQAGDYLGRYGVLRNNWYDINVTGISRVGSPVIPKNDETPDDEIDQYLRVQINILAWAKRTQDVMLK